MQELFRSCSQVRRSLGDNYFFIRDKFDPIRIERPLTSLVAKKAFRNVPSRCCAICGKPFNGAKPQRGHIIPLAECGETKPENLVLLCTNKSEQVSKRGCHELFDGGYASISEVIEAKEIWINGSYSQELRKKIEERYLTHRVQPTNIGTTKPDEIQSLVSAQKWLMALSALGEKIENSRKETDKIRYLTKEVEILRRRSAIGSLELAEKKYRELESMGNIPKELLSWFYYEGGYVAMLLGRHQRAFGLFNNSIKAISEDMPGYAGQWSAAVGLITQTTIAIHGKDSPFDRIMKMADKARKLCANVNGIHANRWMDNWNWNIARINLVRGDLEKAMSAVNGAENHWRKMNVLDGWSAGSSATHRIITGTILAEKATSSAEAKEAMRHLSRALVMILGGGRQHPEMVRDLLFAIGKCIELSSMESRANEIRKTATNTRDGSSWQYPYKEMISGHSALIPTP